MATKLLNRDNLVDNLRQFRIFDDFMEYTSGDIWTTTSDTGTAAVDADGVGGLLLLTTDSTDDDEVLIETREVYKVATDKPLMAIARANLNAVTALTADVTIGFMDAVAGDSIPTGGGVPASKHLAVFTHPTGTGNLLCHTTSTAAGTYTQSTSDATVVDNSYHSYMILVEPISSTDKRVTYYFDPDGGVNFQQLKDANDLLIQHTWSLADTAAGTGELSLMAGIRAASAEAQVLTFDYFGAYQLR